MTSRSASSPWLLESTQGLRCGDWNRENSDRNVKNSLIAEESAETAREIVIYDRLILIVSNQIPAQVSPVNNKIKYWTRHFEQSTFVDRVNDTAFMLLTTSLRCPFVSILNSSNGDNIWWRISAVRSFAFTHRFLGVPSKQFWWIAAVTRCRQHRI